MKVSTNYDTCIASGNCGHIAPNVFRNPEEHGGFVHLLHEHPPEAEWPIVRRAERLCPSATIRIVDDAGRAGAGHPG